MIKPLQYYAKIWVLQHGYMDARKIKNKRRRKLSMKLQKCSQWYACSKPPANYKKKSV